jgi:hypothetical protein
MNTKSILKSNPSKATPTPKVRPTFNHKRQEKWGFAEDISTVVGVQTPSPAPLARMCVPKLAKNGFYSPFRI